MMRDVMFPSPICKIMKVSQLSLKEIKEVVRKNVSTSHQPLTVAISKVFDANTDYESSSILRRNIKRRVNPEGVEMLGARLYYQDSQLKVQALENRIKRLVYEDERAKKLTQIANEKSEKLLRARERHERELERKEQIRLQRMEEVLRQQERNKTMKIIHQQKLSSTVDEIREQNRNLKFAQKMVSYEITHKKSTVADDDHQRRISMKRQVEERRHIFERVKKESKDMQLEKQKYQYRMMLEEQNRKAQANKDKLESLEDIERMLLEKLGKTQLNQHAALANLHKVVQLCNTSLSQKGSSETSKRTRPAPQIINIEDYNSVPQQLNSGKQGKIVFKTARDNIRDNIRNGEKSLNYV